MASNLFLGDIAGIPVGSATDEDEPVDVDHIVRGELLDGVPISSSGVRIVVGRDVWIDRRLADMEECLSTLCCWVFVGGVGLG